MSITEHYTTDELDDMLPLTMDLMGKYFVYQHPTNFNQVYLTEVEGEDINVVHDVWDKDEAFTYINDGTWILLETNIDFKGNKTSSVKKDDLVWNDKTKLWIVNK